jgi:hypothetical protein
VIDQQIKEFFEWDENHTSREEEPFSTMGTWEVVDPNLLN